MKLGRDHYHIEEKDNYLYSGRRGKSAVKLDHLYCTDIKWSPVNLYISMDIMSAKIETFLSLRNIET